MWKRLAAISLATLLLLLSAANIQCRVKINGREVYGCFSPKQLDSCYLTAALAAEEILEGPVSMPEMKRSYRLSFKEPEGSSLLVTDTLLRAVSGIDVVEAVFVNGEQIGAVKSGTELYNRLRSFIRNQMPTTAVSGTISGRLSIQRLYSRQGQETNYRDMVLLVSGMAPVIYLDEKGKLV